MADLVQLTSTDFIEGIVFVGSEDVVGRRLHRQGFRVKNALVFSMCELEGGREVEVVTYGWVRSFN
jgi:hypothetical protein